MTLYQRSAWFTAAVISGFLMLCSFNYGRLTASTISLRSQCDITAEQRAGLKAPYYEITYRGDR